MCFMSEWSWKCECWLRPMKIFLYCSRGHYPSTALLCNHRNGHQVVFNPVVWLAVHGHATLRWLIHTSIVKTNEHHVSNLALHWCRTFTTVSCLIHYYKHWYTAIEFQVLLTLSNLALRLSITTYLLPINGWVTWHSRVEAMPTISMPNQHRYGVTWYSISLRPPSYVVLSTLTLKQPGAPSNSDHHLHACTTVKFRWITWHSVHRPEHHGRRHTAVLPSILIVSFMRPQWQCIYGVHEKFVNLLTLLRLQTFFFPSIYISIVWRRKSLLIIFLKRHFLQ